MLQGRRVLPGLPLLLSLVIARLASAQHQIVVEGTVRSETGDPLQGAQLSVSGMALGTIADAAGRYSFKVPADSVHDQRVALSARFIGYAMDSVTVVFEGDTVWQDFVLRPRQILLGQIILLGPDRHNSERKELDQGVGYRYPNALRSAQLDELRGMRHAAGEREIRVWSGVSTARPKRLYRLVERGGAVKGELIYHWEWTYDPDTDTGTSELRASAPIWCAAISFEGQTWSCRARFAPEPNWKKIWSVLQADGIFGPHDYSLMKSKFDVDDDGTELTVEYWDGHAYHRWTPRAGNSRKELDRGKAIGKVLQSVASSAVPMS